MNTKLQNNKIIKLLEKIAEQNQQIIDNMQYRGLGYPIYLDERFTGPVQHDKWQPYKGPDCENRTTTPTTHTSYDGTKSTLPVTVPEKWTATQVNDFMWKNRYNF